MTIWSHLGVAWVSWSAPFLASENPQIFSKASVQGTTPSLEALKYLWSATVRATCPGELGQDRLEVRWEAVMLL